MFATCLEYRIQFQEPSATRSTGYRLSAIAASSARLGSAPPDSADCTSGLGVVFGPRRDRRDGDSALDRAAERAHVLGLVVRLDRGLITPALHHDDLAAAVQRRPE